MGTSSTKRGRIDKSDSNLWKSFKNSASRYFSGNGSFETAMAKCIIAYGGVELFSVSKNEKKTAITKEIFNVIRIAKSKGLKGVASSLGIQLSEELDNNQILILIGNKLLENQNVSGEDSFIREETLQCFLALSPLFDESGLIKQNDDIVNSVITAMIQEDLTKDILNQFLEACPKSVENKNVELVDLKIDEGYRAVKEVVMAEFEKEFDLNNFSECCTKIKQKVLNLFLLKRAKA